MIQNVVSSIKLRKAGSVPGSNSAMSRYSTWFHYVNNRNLKKKVHVQSFSPNKHLQTIALTRPMHVVCQPRRATAKALGMPRAVSPKFGSAPQLSRTCNLRLWLEKTEPAFLHYSLLYTVCIYIYIYVYNIYLYIRIIYIYIDSAISSVIHRFKLHSKLGHVRTRHTNKTIHK